MFDAVKRAATAAMAATKWECTHLPHRVTWTRYLTDMRRMDPLNGGKVEMDALTEAGVWFDDSQAYPVTMDKQIDRNGPDRVVIIIQRLRPHFEPYMLVKKVQTSLAFATVNCEPIEKKALAKLLRQAKKRR
jgi:Endodeoxyribonuclease RusA